MKPISSQPHDPLDELLAAAVHGELTAAQRAELEALLQHDPAARAAYQEIQNMHDLLERNHRDAKPDPNFEERMISGVRREKAKDEDTKRESAWDSLLFIWRAVKWPFVQKPGYTFASLGAAVFVAMLVVLHEGQTVRGVFSTINPQLQLAQTAPKMDFKETHVPPANLFASKSKVVASAGDEVALDYGFNHNGQESASTLADANSKHSQHVPQLESQLSLANAKLLAQQGQIVQAKKELQKSTREWPGNPALKDSASTFSWASGCDIGFRDATCCRSCGYGGRRREKGFRSL